MKNLLFAIMLLSSFSAIGQSHTDVIKKELNYSTSSSDNLITVKNVNGDVIVEGYNGDKIIIEATRIIDAKNKEKLERGKDDFTLGIHEEDSEVVIYNKTPCTHLKQKKTKKGTWEWQTWQNNCEWENGIHLHLDIKIKVPQNANLAVSTVNNGVVNVKNVRGELYANNINGGIELENISGKTNVHAINGDVKISYSKNPSADSRYYSLNGDIEAFFQKGLSAQVDFESMNGNIFSNIDDIKILPTIVEKKKSKNGIKYKVGGKTSMQIRNGSTLLDFETLNGNVFVKEM